MLKRAGIECYEPTREAAMAPFANTWCRAPHLGVDLEPEEGLGTVMSARLGEEGWYISHDGRQLGPLTDAKLRELVQAGQIKQDD